MMLLDYDKFSFIKVLLRNRSKINYCTRLKQAQSDAERKVIEEEMSKGWMKTVPGKQWLSFMGFAWGSSSLSTFGTSPTWTSSLKDYKCKLVRSVDAFILLSLGRIEYTS